MYNGKSRYDKNPMSKSEIAINNQSTGNISQMTAVPRYTGIALLLAVGVLMQALDGTIVVTALPTIAEKLHQSPLDLQWTIIGYTLAVGLFLPLSGWLIDKLGIRTAFQLAIVIFCVESLCCALSSSLAQLVASRVLQGIGGAILMPLASLAILRIFPKQRLFSAMNITITAGLLGPVIGPILGGVFVTYATWHWIFLINLPIGLLGVLASTKLLPNTKGISRRFDKLGFVLFGSAVFVFIFALDSLNTHDLSVAAVGVLLLLSFVLFALYFLHGRRCEEPLLHFGLLRQRLFRLGLIISAFFVMVIAVVPYVLPLLWQLGFHRSAEESGWMLAPIAIGGIVAKLIITPLLEKTGYKRLLMGAALTFCGLTVAIGFMSEQWHLWLIVVILFIYGFTISLAMGPLKPLTVSEVSADSAGDASVVLSVVRQICASVGIAVATLLIVFLQKTEGLSLIDSFHATIWVAASLVVGGIVTILWLKSTDGKQLL